MFSSHAMLRHQTLNSPENHLHEYGNRSCQASSSSSSFCMSKDIASSWSFSFVVHDPEAFIVPQVSGQYWTQIKGSKWCCSCHCWDATSFDIQHSKKWISAVSQDAVVSRFCTAWENIQWDYSTAIARSPAKFPSVKTDWSAKSIWHLTIDTWHLKLESANDSHQSTATPPGPPTGSQLLGLAPADRSSTAPWLPLLTITYLTSIVKQLSRVPGLVANKRPVEPSWLQGAIYEYMSGTAHKLKANQKQSLESSSLSLAAQREILAQQLSSTCCSGLRRPPSTGTAIRIDNWFAQSMPDVNKHIA